jgi:putative DNA primase/helicase
MNDVKRYGAITDEVCSLMPEEDVSAAVTAKSHLDRVYTMQRLLRQAMKDSSFGYWNGRLYYYGGRLYEEMSNDDFGDFVYAVLLKCGLPAPDFSRLDSIIMVCKRALSGKRLSVRSDVMAFSNCLLDTCTGEVSDFSASVPQLYAVGYPYDKEAQCPLWKAFLNQVLPNRIYQRVMQEFLGSLFVPRDVAKMETMMILYGNGSNGKSVVYETVKGVLGAESVSAFGLDELLGGTVERKRNIASINGKRLNYCSETRRFSIDANSGTLKALISGEPVEARAMYGDNFTADQIPRIMVNANRLPELNDWSYGMRRRLCILPFERRIPPSKQRTDLAAELRKEYSGILNWMLEGRDLFVSHGYRMTQSLGLQNLVAEYEAANSTSLNFMNDMGYLSSFDGGTSAKPCWISSRELYLEYGAWCGRKTEVVSSRAKFGRELSDAGYKKRRGPDGYEYALFGEKALARLLRNDKKVANATEHAISVASSKFPVLERKQFEQEIGGPAAFGKTELSKALGVPKNVIEGAYASGKLDGTFVTLRGVAVFSENLVRDYWYKQWLETEQKKIKAGVEARKRSVQQRDAFLNGLDVNENP